MGMPKNRVFYIILMIMVAVAPTSMIFQVVAVFDPPKYIHLTWNTDNLAHTIVVTWSTTGSGSGDNVYYRNSSSQYKYSTAGSHHTYSGSSLYVHDVLLSGLSPETTYYFICGGTGGNSTERAFHTAPTTSSPITFVAGGDSQTNGAPREQVSRMMATYNPSFVLRTGDYCESDTISEWSSWLADVENHWIGSNGLTIPLIGAIGNHEGSRNNYYGQFNFPGNEMWYSLNWGSDLHIIVLSSENAITGEQLTWLKQDLAANQDAKWKVVLFHQPPYSSGLHGSSTSIRNAWCPLFDQYGVDLVFNGHDHDYERSKPIYNQAIVPDATDGTTYIVGGGWGAPLRSVGTNWWTAYSRSIHHFMVVKIDGNTLNLTAYDQYAVRFDSVQWQKNAISNIPPTAAFSYSPPNPTANIPIQFTDQSTDTDGTVTSWSWNFGDGGTSTLQNPTYEYSASGTYNVRLTVTDNKGATDYDEQSISITNSPPTSAFTFSPPNPATGVTVTFTDMSSDSDGSIASWSWIFGDKGISTVKNPTHQYLATGTYTVTLTVTDNRGGTGSSTHTITVTPGTTYVLTISVNPSGAGTTNPSVGVYNYAAGSQVTITAIAASGYVFNGWSGDASGTSPTTTVTMSSNKNVIANFKTSNNLALKKTAASDSSQYGRGPAYGNDGNTATRWCAAIGYIILWWKVDLGASYSLPGTEVMWEYA